MKSLYLLIPILLLGCTKTQYKDFKRVSLCLQRAEFTEVSISTNGTVTLKGYKNDGGAESMALIAGAAAEGAVRGMKK